MGRKVVHYAFKASVPVDEIENTLILAILAAMGLHGQTRVLLEAACCFDPERHACVIDAGSDVGRDICSVFTGFVSAQFGEAAFTVCRVPEAECRGRARTGSRSCRRTTKSQSRA